MLRKVINFIIFFPLLIFTVGSCVNLNAEENHWQDALTVNGYYTLGATYSDSEVPIISNGNILRVLDEDELTFKNSIAGLQLRYDFTDVFSFFVQGSALFDKNNDFDSSLDWAYLSYDMGYDAKIRVGRFQIPLLQGTELKNIGYSRLWANPLVPNSGAGGYKDYEGLELLKKIALENSNLNFQVAVGKPSHELSFIDGKLLGLVSAGYEARNYWIRGALLHINYEISTANDLLIDDSAQALTASIEAEYQYQKLIINAGLSDSNTDITPDSNMAYLSLGYQVNNHLTPYILGKISRLQFESYSVPGRPGVAAPAVRPPPRLPPASPDGDRQNDSLALGFRYDLDGGYAVKVQWEHVKTEDDSRANQGTVRSRGNVLSVFFEGVF